MDQQPPTHIEETSLPPNPKRHRQKPPVIVWLLAALVIVIGFVWHHYATRNPAKIPSAAPKPIPVQVATARITDVPVFIPALGAVTPLYNVTVRTQVNGRLLRVDFQEGQMVKKGQPLAEIDPRPFEAQLVQFEGQLERDQALLDNARLDLKRYSALYPVGAVSGQVYETQKWTVKQLEGTVKSDLGQVEGAKVNLAYCYITSPVDGMIGLRLVDPGNFVQTGDSNGLAVVNTIQPITVVFSIPEDDIPPVMRQLRAGKKLLAQAYNRTQNQLLAAGILLTINNQVDTATGTVKLKALFTNENNNLFPNQFVNVRLLVDTLRQVVVIPTAAIQNGPKGTFVFLLNSNQTVSMKPVTVGVVSGDESVVTEGIVSGQSVVTDGIDKLIEGSTVNVLKSPELPVLPPPVRWEGRKFPLAPPPMRWEGEKSPLTPLLQRGQKAVPRKKMHAAPLSQQRKKHKHRKIPAPKKCSQSKTAVVASATTYCPRQERPHNYFPLFEKERLRGISLSLQGTQK